MRPRYAASEWGATALPAEQLPLPYTSPHKSQAHPHHGTEVGQHADRASSVGELQASEHSLEDGVRLIGPRAI